MKLKKRVWIAALTLLFTQTDSLAQYASYNGKKPIIVSAGEIRGITVSGNVDVVMRHNPKTGTAVNVEVKNTGKLKAFVSGDELFLDNKEQAGNERITVYVWTNDLREITLKDNSYAVSLGILQLKNLQVNIHDNARVAIRTRDRIRYTAPTDRPLISNEKFYSVISADR